MDGNGLERRGLLSFEANGGCEAERDVGDLRRAVLNGSTGRCSGERPEKVSSNSWVAHEVLAALEGSDRTAGCRQPTPIEASLVPAGHRPPAPDGPSHRLGNGPARPSDAEGESARQPERRRAVSSISTGMSNGSSARPTALRVWRPASPKTSTRRSEHPSMTAGAWLKPGATLTMPNTLTKRSMRSRSPSSDCKVARIDSAVMQRRVHPDDLADAPQ